MRRLIVGAASAWIIAGCGGTSNETPSTPSAPATTSPLAMTSSPSVTTPLTGIVITTGESQFGQMLFNAGDQAIYVFDKEKTSTPECYDDCASVWPPVLSVGAPVADGDVDPSLLGVTDRTDGTTQVTYGGKPLYYYHDEGPGEVKCHNVETHGGLWLVIDTAGKPLPT